MRWNWPNETRQEIPILEDSQKQYRLDHPNRAKPRSRLVKSADQRLPQENAQTSGTDHSTQLCVGKIQKKEAAARENHQGAVACIQNPEQHRAGQEKKKVVVPGIEDHAYAKAFVARR
jgi:hypothetical protein